MWLWSDTQDSGSVVTAKLKENPEFLRYGNIVLPADRQTATSSFCENTEKYFYTMICGDDVTQSEAFVIQKWQIEIDKIRSREWTKLD